jgi:ATP dependent DNA ligase domain
VKLLWCFDLLTLDGRDVRQLPLLERRAALRQLLTDAGDDTLRFSEEFADPVKLLQVAESMGLEGIVSKRAEQPYVSGGNPGWVKVKTRSWREANADRHKLFGNRRKRYPHWWAPGAMTAAPPGKQSPVRARAPRCVARATRRVQPHSTVPPNPERALWLLAHAFVTRPGPERA